MLSETDCLCRQADVDASLSRHWLVVGFTAAFPQPFGRKLIRLPPKSSRVESVSCRAGRLDNGRAVVTRRSPPSAFVSTRLCLPCVASGTARVLGSSPSCRGGDRVREPKDLAQAHTASGWRTWGVKPSLFQLQSPKSSCTRAALKGPTKY